LYNLESTYASSYFDNKGIFAKHYICLSGARKPEAFPLSAVSYQFTAVSRQPTTDSR
jgi:hypothetical protein